MRQRIILLAPIAAVLFSQTLAPAQDCVWRPWAANWSTVNKGADLAPPNLVYNPTNWDFSLSQSTVLNMPKNTPDGSTYAMHVFFDSQPPAGSSNAAGSGGVYQEITVQPGKPLHYTFWWKGKCGGTSGSWYEFLLLNSGWDRGAADSGSPTPNRKRSLTNSEFGWEQLDDQTNSWVGTGGKTLTPTGTTVTIVFKCGHNPAPGGVEVFIDAVDVWQDADGGGRGPNLVTNGGFDDTAQAPVCDNQPMWQKTPDQGSYWLALTQCVPVQHTTTSVNPTSGPNTSDTVMTITGTSMGLVATAKLVPVAGGPEIVGTFTPPGTNATDLVVTFPTTGKLDGFYDVVTAQNPLPCLTKTLPSAFQLTCPGGATVSGVSPASVTDPGASVALTISGTNVTALTAARLESAYGDKTVTATLSPSGSDMIATVDLSCAPAGAYHLVASVAGCRDILVENAVRVVKIPPGGSCAWTPWTSSWSTLNLGDAMNPPDNNVYNPTNWDYAFGQTTLLNTPKDTPDASARALHWFLDAQPPAGSSNGQGSGGVYQQVAVQPGVPVQYSFWWKGAADSGTAWFEFMLIDGPFSFGEADLDQESASHNNPALLRKRTLSTVDTFAWQQVTDQLPADTGPAGPRQTTITPTGSIITVVLKAGRAGPGAMESFWDAVVISQNSGPNLLVNGDFESAGQLAPCENQYMFQNSCEGGYWTHSAFVACPTPFADTDDDQDVDQEDFGRFQACFAPGEPVSAECSCFDRPQPIQPNGSIDQADFAAFTLCITGPEVDWVSNVNCP